MGEQIETCHASPLTDDERRKAKAWVTARGWCSCCVRGLRWGTATKVVHIGLERQNVALCVRCLGKMTRALSKDGG